MRAARAKTKRRGGGEGKTGDKLEEDVELEDGGDHGRGLGEVDVVADGLVEDLVELGLLGDHVRVSAAEHRRVRRGDLGAAGKR